MNTLPLNARLQIEQTIHNLVNLAEYSIETLVTEVYGNGARFVFELLQNADDNKFERARRDEEPPFISFAKVHIESGYFSFYFKYEKGDPNLAMVTPVWQDTAEELPYPLTRMTLSIHDKGNPDDLEHLRDTIFEQINDLRPTFLLFLSQLQRIRIAFHDKDGELNNYREFLLGPDDDQRVFLETVNIDGDGKSTTERQHYHLTRYTTSGIARSENRNLSVTDASQETSSTAEIVLAFPLSKDSRPVVDKKQEIFAFLPVRQMSFKVSFIRYKLATGLLTHLFLIHTDFDTNASREDIIPMSRRNIDLLNGIAAAFVQAALQFCKHDDLCYTWPEFLPPSEDYMGPFWSGLAPRIEKLLRETPVLRSRRRKDLRKVQDVIILPGWAHDEDGEPLLDDNDTDCFLSRRYMPRSYAPLRGYGLRRLTFRHFLHMLAADLRLPASKMKIPFIPLRDGNWVCADSGPVYLPDTQGIPVPQGVDFRVLDPAAVVNEDRRKLFSQLGAVEPQVETVRSSVLAIYDSSNSSVDVEDSRQHLHFLYLTHHQERDRDELRHIYLHTHIPGTRKPFSEDLYLPQDHAYGPKALLQSGADWPGLSAMFVEPWYLENIPQKPFASHPSWKAWLRDYVGVRDRVRLVSRDRGSLSEAVTYVAVHRPEMFLGLLEYLWKYEGSQLAKSVTLRDQARGISAVNLCNRPELLRDHVVSIKDTWLPLPSLKTQCRRFMEESEPFPFLKFEDTTSEEEPTTKWMFLHSHLSVGRDDNVDFLLSIAYWIKEANPSPSSASLHERVLSLYTAIDARCHSAVHPQCQRDSTRAHFKSFENIFIPEDDEEEALWVGPDVCLWDAPQNTALKCPLEYLYGSVLGTPPDQMKLLERFFKHTLSVPDASWQDIVQELENLKDYDDDDFDCIRGFYEYLNSMDIIAFTEDLRREFEDKGLIFATKNGQPSWHKISECLWSSTTEIRGKITLNDDYEELSDFFISKLGVGTLTLQMVYDELLLTTSRTPVRQLKNTIRSFNALLRTEQDALCPQPLLEACIFPVRYADGVLKLRSAKTEFAIVDREHLAERLRGRIKMLDYTLEQVWRLQPFFEWAGLQGRYLSVAVKEITSVARSECETRPMLEPSRDIKRKAHALLRVAAAFDSPRYQADAAVLYRLFRTAKTMEAESISPSLIIHQNGKSIEVEEGIGDVNVSDGASGLEVYVPSDKTAQDICFDSSLPRHLADWLMRGPTTQIGEEADNAAVVALTALLNARLSAVHQILDRRGIIHVDVPDEAGESEYELPSTHDQVSDEDAGPSRPDTPGSVATGSSGNRAPASTPSEPPGSCSEPESPDSVVEQITHRRAHRSHRSPAAAAVLSTPDPQPHQQLVSAEDSRYRELLDRVIAAARTATLPSRVYDMSGIRDALSGALVPGFDGLDSINRFRSSNQLERDKKIGAAGELYVFELLSCLDPTLAGWSRANWQSTIRRYVNIHPDYADMTSWDRRETADMVYDDTEGDLTSWLIDCDYLSGDDWEHARPRYYLEVKTTTGPCDTPFYMSKRQYQLVRKP
ncbi:Autophagy-related protein 9 [Madurella mycetomatis]|uniref:Autophagy-related protein 9 n=1 Tax=Madurella mycetomatis TaxID=100816 RepID=A0A175VTH7_9PEZI|nr:Autophagy-related protein 9 [Madurella mycetomatis]